VTQTGPKLALNKTLVEFQSFSLFWIPLKRFVTKQVILPLSDAHCCVIPPHARGPCLSVIMFTGFGWSMIWLIMYIKRGKKIFISTKTRKKVSGKIYKSVFSNLSIFAWHKWRESCIIELHLIYVFVDNFKFLVN
jgi:hypothetical protein